MHQPEEKHKPVNAPSPLDIKELQDSPAVDNILVLSLF